LSAGQVATGIAVGLLAIVEALAVGPLGLLKTVVALMILFYVLFVGFKVVLWWAAAGHHPSRHPVPAADSPDLPTYTILVPLRGEAEVAHRLVDSLSALRYPTDKLQILLLLEEYDTETRLAVARIGLPSHFEVLLVPDIGPRTKPKACNFGYTHATGEMIVIYDAEDRPEPDQLLQAVAYFNADRIGHARVGCVQARLSFWNPRGSWISSFYWAEYVAHFEGLLLGLARLRLIPPLGGTSNHFRIHALEAVSRANGAWKFDDSEDVSVRVTMRGPWDPYNVTEDADLAFRLALAGYRIGMLASTTYEEAPDTARKAKNQRSRWLQGYAQTGLVHSRHPLEATRAVGPLRYFAFLLLIVGTPLSLLLNPLMWGATILYVVARVDGLSTISTFIESLFPPPVFYAGISVALVGNAVLFYQKLITPLVRQQRSELAPEAAGQHMLGAYLRQQEYGLVFRLLFIPFWWAFTSISAYRAVRKLLVPSLRSHWEKTPHGHALATEAEVEIAFAREDGFLGQSVVPVPREP
jgi:cellulose synthase/poly-beta-1,6-N-acetylglucosamine synthase-like glycosyltransferase